MNDDAAKPGPGHPLEEIVDDEEAISKCRRWAFDELAKGRTAEEVAANLSAAGWDEQEAADIAERARRETRHLRGVVTRQEVARKARESFYTGWGRGWLIGFGIIGPLCCWRLLNSLILIFRGILGKKPAAPCDWVAGPAAPWPVYRCRQCGRELHEAAQHCPQCGAEVEINRSANPPGPG